jgi:hypothetical protein
MRTRLLIRKALGLLLAVLSMPLHLLADDWAAPQVREVFSTNRSYFVRVTQGDSWGESVGFKGAQIGKHARAEFFHVQADRSYRLETEIELLNPVAPVDFFVSNAGDLVTRDNWHNVGYGAVLAVYHADGNLVKAYQLAELFPKSEIDSFSASVSSIWWHKGPAYINEDQRTFYMRYRVARLSGTYSEFGRRLCASVC